VVVQTRRGEDPVLAALRDADFGDIIDDDVAVARLLELTPYGALADVSGEGAGEFVAALDDPRVTVTATPTGYVLSARDVATLTSALRATPRPHAKVRVAVQ
jgi:hypothetical protein